jgi:hypothetical protein
MAEAARHLPPRVYSAVVAKGVLLEAPLPCQNATEVPGDLRFGTRLEQTALESAAETGARLFTVKCRCHSEAPHQIQSERQADERLSGDKG